ncbi:uncharacterized protein I303_102513 [Kwoniella dejecticola CBS 10117]|uniref:Shugoshin C-terminal domain-containing protein n=1 Tax=Kwoniella dejecticola CBS 10117 TaxID=1296121 RepID=A0A1A6A8Y7_9TREE|nr:uncharacterized protein I303_02527 [Kwoniella dejecticola CBS 10117]OBR86519.1 hypothetical protein I303_02527 [Kwoniella dejecticola CBS 10117]
MAQRQGRRSLGLAPLPGLGDELTDAQRFEDFRRRHSKQNKEIILDNVGRKNTIKSLEDDIARLNIELLNVRRANFKLRARLENVQREKSRSGDKQVYEALNQLIGIFPALKSLRDSLSPSTSNYEDEVAMMPNGNGDGSAAINGIPIPIPIPISLVQNTYATRPAEMARQNHGLWSLVEAKENSGSEKEEDDWRRVPKKSARRNAGMGSIASSRSPRRSGQSPKVTYMEITSPSPSKPRSRSKASASPSPKKSSTSMTPITSSVPSTTSSSVAKKQRRRRESGLITITPRSPSPPPPTVCPNQEPDNGEYSEWEEGQAIDISPSDADVDTSPDLNTRRQNEDISMPLDISSLSSSGGPGAKQVELLDTIKEVSTAESATSSSASSRQPAVGQVGQEEEKGNGRGRRSRSSVNYKEPSLSKKMRKPDGVSTEEFLLSQSNPRRSLAAGMIPPTTSQPNTPPKSTSPFGDDSPLSPLPDLADDLHYQLQPAKNGRTGMAKTKTNTNNNTNTNPLIRPEQSAMRRKSTLPKAGNKKRVEDEDKDEDEDEDDDEFDVDELIGAGSTSAWEDDYEDVNYKTGNLMLNSPAKSKDNGNGNGNDGRKVTPMTMSIPSNHASSSSSNLPSTSTSTSNVNPTSSSTSTNGNTNGSGKTYTGRSTTTMTNENTKSSFRPVSSSKPSISTSTSSASNLGIGRPVVPPSNSNPTRPTPSITTGSRTGSRNFTPTSRISSTSNKKAEVEVADILTEGNNDNMLNIPSKMPTTSSNATATATARKVSDTSKKPPVTTTTTARARRMSSAV